MLLSRQTSAIDCAILIRFSRLSMQEMAAASTSKCFFDIVFSFVLNQVVLIRIINISYYKNLSIKKHRREAVFLTDIFSFGLIYRCRRSTIILPSLVPLEQ